MKKYILYNPISNSGNGDKIAHELLDKIDGDLINVFDCNKKELVASLASDDEIYLIGGDGTINFFINDLDGVCPKNKVFLYKAGTGNDFLRDVKFHGDFIILNPYLEHLPKVEVNGIIKYFINGVGFGIDGYCCEIGDEQRKKSNKPVNYTGIAIKGILFHYKPCDAKVTIDGVTKEYKNVWLSPTMNGRYYGGGMMVAPQQDRLHNDTLTNMVYLSKSKLKALMSFPSIFKGEHIKKTKIVTLTTGKTIEVEFSKPTSLQIDGETILNVTKYKAWI